MLKEKNFKPLHSITKNILLVVEDSDEDYEMFQRAVKKTEIECNLFQCETGKEALNFLNNEKDYQDSEKYKKPSLILLDLNLPGINGRKVLEKIKSNPAWRKIPVVIFSTSSNARDIEDCYDKGANGYIIKPMNIDLLQEYTQILLLHWLKINTHLF